MSRYGLLINIKVCGNRLYRVTVGFFVKTNASEFGFIRVVKDVSPFKLKVARYYLF